MSGEAVIVAGMLMVWATLKSNCKEKDHDTRSMPYGGEATLRDDGESVRSTLKKETQNALRNVGLRARKVDQCTGSDQGDPKANKHRLQCQNPAANAVVPLGTTVEYVVR